MNKLYLIVIIVLGISTLFAQTAVPPAAGSGTEEDPYQIETLDNLYWISTNVDEWSKYYIQIADIDASETENWFDGQGWLPIGEDGIPFMGFYDGQDHAIDGLNINRPETSDIGLFGSAIYGPVINLGLTNVDISGDNFVGSLIGNSPDITVENCYSSGSINGVSNVGGLLGLNGGTVKSSYSSADVTGDNTVGGLVGYNINGSIENSHSQGTVSGDFYSIGGLVGLNSMATILGCHNESTVNGDENIGGLVGFHSAGGLIEDSYNFGEVSGVSNVGGLVGWSTGEAIKSSYNAGEVNGIEAVGGLAGYIMTTSLNDSYNIGSIVGDEFVGGLIGEIVVSSPVTHCYSNGSVIGNNNAGGLIGYINDDPEVINSYWDMESSGQSTSAGGEGRTTEEMTYPYANNTYVDWDFEDVWAEDANYEMNNGYPYLREVSIPVSADDDLVISQPDMVVYNYPNPFNPETTITYSIEHSANVTIHVFNLKGQLVDTILDEKQNAGTHGIVWKGTDKAGNKVSSGVYFYEFKLDGRTEAVRKCLLLK